MLAKEIKPGVVYRITKSDSSGSVFAGELCYVDKKTCYLVFANCGWLERSEWKDMDFECEPAPEYKVVQEEWRTYIKKVQ